MSGGEEAFVAWLRRRLPPPILVGDDTAALPPPARGNHFVVTVDQQIEGSHFAPGLDPTLLGRRLLGVNLSDIAAAGALPRWALLTLALPPEADPRPIVEGVLAEAKRHGVALAGGDVARGELLAATLTLIGEKSKRDAPLTRDRARPGQAIWVGGTLGESALGCELLLRGAHIHGRRISFPHGSWGFEPGRPLEAAARRAVRRNVLPLPQLALGRWLAGLGARRAGACIDISDGLAKDLRRICTASGVGAEVDLHLLHAAVPPRFDDLAEALGLDPIAVALAGGEDYVLLFTLPVDVEPPARFRAVRVGRVLRGRRLVMLDAAGARHPLPHLGWDHLSPAEAPDEEA